VRPCLTNTLTLVVVLMVPALPAWTQEPSRVEAEMEWEAVADGEGASGATEPAGPAYLSVLDVIGKLTIAVLIAYGLSLAVRWAQQRYPRTQSPAGGQCMNVEEALSLGGDAKLYIVAVEGRRVLLASQGGNIHHIADLDHGPAMPSSGFRSAPDRPTGERDELNIVQAPVSTRAVRSDVVSNSEEWARRRDQILRELQDT